MFAATLLAQVITVAALGRAAYLAFYRRRSDDYEHLEPLRVGRVPEPRPIRVLRAVHTGSVNDYAGFATAGLLTVLLVLLA